jgi:hypothetical protein
MAVRAGSHVHGCACRKSRVSRHWDVCLTHAAGGVRARASEWPGRPVTATHAPLLCTAVGTRASLTITRPQHCSIAVLQHVWLLRAPTSAFTQCRVASSAHLSGNVPVSEFLARLMRCSEGQLARSLGRLPVSWLLLRSNTCGRKVCACDQDDKKLPAPPLKHMAETHHCWWDIFISLCS